MRPRHLLVPVALLLGATGAAASPTPISSCTALTKPGSYVLQQDVFAAQGFCISIDASFVTLDLDGHVIVGPGGGVLGPGISNMLVGGVRGTVIRNGAVTGFNSGIQADRATIEKMRVFDNGNVGILASASIVRDNLVSGQYTGSSVGPSTLVTGNVVTGNQYGVIASYGSTVSGNVVGLNNAYGLSVDCPSLVLGTQDRQRSA